MELGGDGAVAVLQHQVAVGAVAAGGDDDALGVDGDLAAVGAGGLTAHHSAGVIGQQGGHLGVGLDGSAPLGGVLFQLFNVDAAAVVAFLAGGCHQVHLMAAGPLAADGHKDVIGLEGNADLIFQPFQRDGGLLCKGADQGDVVHRPAALVGLQGVPVDAVKQVHAVIGLPLGIVGGHIVQQGLVLGGIGLDADGLFHLFAVVSGHLHRALQLGVGAVIGAFTQLGVAADGRSLLQHQHAGAFLGCTGRGCHAGAAGAHHDDIHIIGGVLALGGGDLGLVVIGVQAGSRQSVCHSGQQAVAGQGGGPVQR